MVRYLEKSWLFSIGKRAEIQSLEMGRKPPVTLPPFNWANLDGDQLSNNNVSSPGPQTTVRY